MAKKHPGYRPQKRKPQAETAGTGLTQDVQNEVLPSREVYAALVGLYELEGLESEQPINGLLGMIAFDSIARMALRDEIGDSYNQQDFILAVTTNIRSAVRRFEALTSHDVSKDHHAVQGEGGARVLAVGTSDSTNHLLSGGNSKSAHPDHDAFKNLTFLYVGTPTMQRGRLREGMSILDDEQFEKYSKMFLPYWNSAINDPNAARRKVTAELAFIMSDEVSGLLEDTGYVPDYEEPNSDTEVDIVPNQLLDFTILPPSTGIRELATLVTTGLSEYDKAHVELERLTVLEAIRQHVGEDRCFYARSKAEGKKYPIEDAENVEGSDDSGDSDKKDVLIDESYIVLVIQQHSPDGQVIAENSLAISPIGRKHAAYLTRQDVSGGLSWREILSLGKEDARDLGARSLRFSKSASRDKFDMMSEKIKALLACQPERFGDQLRMCGDGTYRLGNRQRDIGSSALYLHELE